jgi:hypothetical protein
MITIEVKAFGNVREFVITQQHDEGGSTTHHYPAKLSADGLRLELDTARCPDPETVDVPAFRKLLTAWNSQNRG